MNLKERIRKEIAIQKSIEGEQCQDEILLKFLDAMRTSLQWQLLINTQYHRYGKLSYECHRFYYPTKELVDFIALIKQ